MEPPHDHSNSLSSKPPNTMPITNIKDGISDKKHKNPQLILDLTLCRNNHLNRTLDPELDLTEGFKAEYPRDLSKTSLVNEGEPRVFSCNYCQRKFYSSQALGGHQNAHKRERTLAKRGHRINSTSFFGNSSLSNIPLYGSYNFSHKPLGIQAHSLIHKPSISSSSYLAFSGVSSSHHGWSKMPLVDQQTRIGRLGVGSPSSTSTSSSSNGRAPRFDSLQKHSQPLDRNLGGVCWKGSAKNVLKISSNKQEYDQLNNLDLSLKL